MKEKYDWATEFQDFLRAEQTSPPSTVADSVLTRVARDLHPSPSVVFMKVAASVAVSGIASLYFCPQFGMGAMNFPWLHQFFMSFGSLGCSVACGAFFTLVGFLSASLMLRPEELRLVGSNRVLTVSALSALSLSAFVCLGATILLESALLWLLGSLAGGVVSIEVASLMVFRSTLSARHISHS